MEMTDCVKRSSVIQVEYSVAFCFWVTPIFNATTPEFNLRPELALRSGFQKAVAPETAGSLAGPFWRRSNRALQE